MNKFYLTTAIPYVNSSPHVGHALEFVQADVVARYQKLQGKEVALLTGSDENSLKNVQAAEKEGISVQALCDKNTKKFQELFRALNVDYQFYQRGTDKKTHFAGSQKLWELCKKSGDIYKKNYQGLYCVGCETFYTEDELMNGKCPEHLKEPELVEEENYFFRLSKYQKFLEDLISSDKLKIIPQTRKNEVLSFIKSGLKDFSISRSKARAKNWGVPVPNDDNQIIYVWFDALNIYQTGIGFGLNEKLYKKWWPADLHIIGKGIIRFHAVYWPAILLSAGLSLPKAIFVHGYLTVNGQKISKSLGNVIDPMELIQKYGTDPLRYYLLREIPAYSDGDFSEKRFVELYNADLANGLGNLVARVLNMVDKYTNSLVPKPSIPVDNLPLQSGIEIETWKKLTKALESYQFNEALSAIWEFIKAADKYIDENKPWDLIKTDKTKLGNVLYDLLESLHQISWQIYPFLPETAIKIAKSLGIEKLLTENPNYKESWTNIKPGTKITLGKPLFPRL